MAIQVLIGVMGAVWAGAVAKRKGHTSMLFALFAFLLPVVGVLFAYVAYPAPPRILRPE